MIALALAVLPGLLWTQGPENAEALRKAGVTEIAVPVPNAAAWAGSGIRIVPVDVEHATRVTEPSVDYRMGTAGATSAPWINSNLWLYLRKPDDLYVCDAVERKNIPLALGEAFAAGVKAYFAVKPEDLDAYVAFAGFLNHLAAPTLPPRANFAVIDDGSDQVGEVMNLLARRNLLFAPVKAPRPGFDATIQLGRPPYTGKIADDPFLTAAEARTRLGDARRLVRLYGSDTTILRLTGDGHRARLHLLHYGGYAVEGLRVRVLGHYGRISVSAPGSDSLKVEDRVDEASAVELTLPAFANYMVIDLE
jgi:hypothetical protein